VNIQLKVTGGYGVFSEDCKLKKKVKAG